MVSFYQITFQEPVPDAEKKLADIFGASLALDVNSFCIVLAEATWDGPKSIIEKSWQGKKPAYIYSDISLHHLDKGELKDKIEALKNLTNSNLLERLDVLTQQNEELRGELSKTKASIPEAANLDVERDRTKELAAIFRELDELIGMEKPKELLREIAAKRKMDIIMSNAGLMSGEASGYHMLATGSSGTGKTTFARLYAKALNILGVLSKGHLIETDRSGLVGQFVGHTEARTNRVLDEAKGGILFVDEAYSLFDGSGNDFGHLALAQIIRRMENDRNDLVVVMAGYTDEIKKLVASNNGMLSRFPHVIHFPDFSEDELYKIALNKMTSKSLTTCEEFEATFRSMAADMRTKTGKQFGNGRFVRNLVELAERAMTARLDADGILDQLINKQAVPVEEVIAHRTLKQADLVRASGNLALGS